MPAASAASWTARLSWRVETGSTELRPGNSQPWGSMTLRRLPSRHQRRSNSRSCGDSIALRSLRPPPSRGQALALFHADQHAGAIDVVDLEGGNFRDPEPGAIGGPERRL